MKKKFVFKMSNEQNKIYKAGKENMKRTVELFNNAKISIKRKKPQKDEDDPSKHGQYCNPVITDNKKTSTALAFSPTFALTEMRSCLMRHDWINLQRLFPLLLEFSSDRETLVWKYIFTIILHSPMSSPSHLEQFLNSCIGCQNDNLNHVLNQFIALKQDISER